MVNRLARLDPGTKIRIGCFAVLMLIGAARTRVGSSRERAREARIRTVP
jgi:hypothetical protein